jgi:hypothetical protein
MSIALSPALRRLATAGAVLTLFACVAFSQVAHFGAWGYTTFGNWYGEIRATPGEWNPGDTVHVTVNMTVGRQHLLNMAADKINVDGLVVLITAERTFDQTGWIRLPSDERMSTLLTPAGLPIEGGLQMAISPQLGAAFKTPFDKLVRIPLSAASLDNGRYDAVFDAEQKLPSDLPPGIYRLRVDFGVAVGTRYYSMQTKTFGYRQSAIQNKPIESHLYSPPIAANGYNRAGEWVKASTLERRLPWVLLSSYNSNGYKGVVAEEDQGRFNIASRNLIHDDVILPMLDNAGNKIAYSLEPQFPTDTIELRSNIPWNNSSGSVTAEITAPDGKTTSLGTFPFAGANGQWPTTKNAALTAWRPSLYGQYTVKLTGSIKDVWGNTYYGGGTYRFWIANRMTMATATFQGMAYPVGYKYGRDIGFAPAAPADVQVDAALFVNGDPGDVRRLSWSGKASPGGIYGTAQGAKQFPLDAPGEYYARILAKYTDAKGVLWVCSMRHAGIVYPADSPIVARGKKLYVGGKYLERGDTNAEGWYDNPLQMGALQHIAFPWNQGDVLLIASEGQGANKIEPVLTYEWKEKPQAWETRLNSIGASNLQMKTSNGYSPHLYPEFITDRAYYYGAGARPGFMGRFLVAEDGVFAPYWPTSYTSFGGQVNASNNGDLPGDIYRLIGGVMLRRAADEKPAYAGYLASSFILPGGTSNNRIVAPGAEDMIGSTGERARFFMVGTRPGMLYETGTTFTPPVQIDPIVPATVTFTLRRPDGQVLTGTATGDASGSAIGPRWVMDIPGIYRFRIDGEWNGHPGFMPGLPAEGGSIYVVEAGKPAGTPELKFETASQTTFDVTQGAHIVGSTTAGRVSFAAVIPGAVIDEGEIEVKNGRFDYFLDPVKLNQRAATYDVVNRMSGKKEVFDVIHLTFFSEETAANGTKSHSFARAIVRGNVIITAR